MDGRSGFFINLDLFDKRLNEIARKSIPRLVREGLFNAGNALLQLAMDEEPRAPKKTGDLWGSRRTELAEDIASFAAEVGFGVPYAARWHEIGEQEAEKINWSLPGSGRKYLEAKMIKYKEKLMQIVVDSIYGGE